MDEREQYWIQKLNTYENGYNQTRCDNQNCRKYDNILIAECNIIVDSCEYLAREIVRITDWATPYIRKQLRQVVDTDLDFCGYHLKTIKANKDELTDIVDLENWIKTLNAKFQGQHIYCEELDKRFDTIGQGAQYLIDNNYYNGPSQKPIQTVISAISYGIKQDKAVPVLNDFHFYKVPGTTKQPGADESFRRAKIVCPELNNQIFDSQISAAHYFVENKIWTGIKVKTAKCRISDVVNGIFPDYRGYTFQRLAEE